MPNATLNALLHAALELTGRADLGVLAAEEVGAGDLDLFELVTGAQSTLGDALSCVERLLPLLHDGYRMTTHAGRDALEARFTMIPGMEVPPAGTDFQLALAVLSMRRATDGVVDEHLREVCFPHPAPAERQSYDRVFRCPLRFGAPHAAVHLSASAAELPLLHASPAVRAALEKVAADVLAAGAERSEFRARVTELIDAQLAAGAPCTAAAVAKKLGLTVRTLQRRLEEQGMSFREVLDAHRTELARAYLSRDSLTVAEVAYLLGFANTPAFHRAFKRWTGQTPAGFRASPGAG